MTCQAVNILPTNLRFKNPILRLDLFDYPCAYIVVKGRISVISKNVANKRNEKLIFKNNAPFRLCIIKINDTFIGNAEDLDIVMQMNNNLFGVRWQIFYDIRSFVEILEIWHKWWYGSK